ncbi:MAG: hypothetical protein ACI9MC_001516 [Kiritimatiellia bacterium]|jgi:hypothetical protein
MLRTSTLTICMVFLSGCGAVYGDVPMAGPCGGGTWLELRSTDVPLQDGDVLAVEHGSQGGFHVLFDLFVTSAEAQAQIVVNAFADGRTLNRSSYQVPLEVEQEPGCHAGTIEHWLVISNARLPNPEELSNRELFDGLQIRVRALAANDVGATVSERDLVVEWTEWE